MTIRFSSSAGRRLRALAALALVLALVAACGGGGPPTGVVSGQLRVGASGASAGGATTLQPIPWRAPDADASVDRALAAAALADRPFVPGEIVVAFEPSLRAAAVDRLSVAGVTLEAVRTLATGGAALYRTTAATLDEALAVAAALEARPDVRYAHPNYLLFPARAPNDPSYAQQWHYRAIDLESAWDVSVGSSDVVVAVLDTGIYYSQADPSKRHPDLVGRVLPGYDFISNATYARDGDGRDPDPFDTVPGNDYHGTHVAGTIGAATDNGVGVAGVDWHARLLPLRVLGDGGGSVADVADAIVWAVGGSVPGVSTNANPARVVNLSLGGAADECYGALADAIARALQSAVVVAAAGNVNQPAIGFTPANCPGAIVVGATDRDGDRASYSNYGSRIDIMAPGGDAESGVLSTGPGNTGPGTYMPMYGTSMAAPHVAGVAALMKAIAPEMSPADFDALLAAGELTNDYGAPGRDNVYGHGLLDAYRAVLAAHMLANGTVPDLPPQPPLVQPPALIMNAQTAAAVVTVSEPATAVPPIAAVRASVPWLSAGPTMTDAAGFGHYTIAADRRGLAPGTYNAYVEVASSAGTVKLPVTVVVEKPSSPGTAGPLHVLLIDARTRTAVAQQTIAATGGIGEFRFQRVPPGSYVIVAGADADADNDGRICGPGEACSIAGADPQTVTVTDDSLTTVTTLVVRFDP
ncbi:MAG TPA: S8 family serine peptidase, partial [Trueperaceae bacterium]|nr:S8 family serine peptidase [Trueperaceae bacterium]